MRAIIIEDETQAISALKSELQLHCPEVIVIDEARTVKDGIEKIKRLQPNIVFLDIQLSDGLGFDILSAFVEHTFKIIFTTAYSQYALKAIKFSALDYLLKPIDSEELKLAISRIKAFQKNDEINRLELLISNIKEPEKRKKIALQTSEGYSIYEIDTIVRCSAESNYTCVYFTNGKKNLFSKTLKDFEELLEGSNFERIHHSHIINLNHLINFVNKDGGYVIMQDKSSVPVSQRKKAQLIDRLNKLK